MSRGFTGSTRKPRRSRHSGNSQHPRGQKGQASEEQRQSDFDRFFYSRGVVSHECAPQSHINKEYYLEVLRRLRDAVRRKRPDLWAEGTWQLYHDNAPAHSSQLIQTFLAKHNMHVVRQTPYSPDMAPCDFWLFPHLTTQLKGTRLETRYDIIRNTNKQDVLRPQIDIPEMPRTMAEPLGEVCSVTRRLLRRGLVLQISRRVNVFFPAKCPIVFDQATYRGSV